MRTPKLIPAIALAAFAAGLMAAGRSPARPVLRSVAFHEDFKSGHLDAWELPYPDDWAILGAGSSRYLHMNRNREPGVPRRPLQFALIKGIKAGSFDFHTGVRRAGKSMIVVFNYIDTLHFYYTHLSGDRGADQPVHNGIFIVNGEPRRRIAGLEAPPALPDQEWHTVRILRDVGKGSIQVFVDAKTEPVFTVQDSTFTCGQLGVGSFDETGDFADVSLQSDDAACDPHALVRPAGL
ncbi:MAG TPA: hypothetical protein VKU44_07965 [Terriglobia bacterium]|nr:hypothetical protein [Terriglobia bacterium]